MAVTPFLPLPRLQLAAPEVVFVALLEHGAACTRRGNRKHDLMLSTSCPRMLRPAPPLFAVPCVVYVFGTLIVNM